MENQAACSKYLAETVVVSTDVTDQRTEWRVDQLVGATFSVAPLTRGTNTSSYLRDLCVQ